MAWKFVTQDGREAVEINNLRKGICCNIMCTDANGNNITLGRYADTEELDEVFKKAVISTEPFWFPESKDNSG